MKNDDRTTHMGIGRIDMNKDPLKPENVVCFLDKIKTSFNIFTINFHHISGSLLILDSSYHKHIYEACLKSNATDLTNNQFQFQTTNCMGFTSQ